MKSTNQKMDHHWNFSVSLYAQPHVATACITLQDTAGVNVNVLLVALWATKITGRAILTSEISEAERKISTWHKKVVEPLRQIRRDLKADLHLSDPIHIESLRSQVKKAELDAEYIEQTALAEWALSLESEVVREPIDEPTWALTTRRVIECYSDGMPDGENIERLEKIARLIADNAALLADRH